MDSQKAKKILVIFDFDSTITDKDSFCTAVIPFLTKEEEKELWISVFRDNYVSIFNYIFKLLKQKGVKKEEYIKNYQALELTAGMEELFSYLKENKDKFEVCLFTSSYSFGVNLFLKHKKLYDIFDEIVCTPSKESSSEEDDQFIYVIQKYTHDCKLCNPCNCKTIDFKEYSLSHDMNNYSKVLFICDGGNDYCLAKNLGKNDAVLPRKDFKLYKNLYGENNLQNTLQCHIEAWSKGQDIIKYLQSLFN